MKTVLSYKFSPTATERPTLEINEPVEFLKRQYVKGYSFGLDNLQRSGTYKLMGWAYDLRPYLKKYVYKQHGQWYEVYAPNKTMLRTTIYGRIDKIVELK